MQEIIKVEHLTKSYGKRIAADNINLSVPRGTVFGLLGANGAGKSTTMECILGTKKADGGKVSVLGMNPLTDRRQLFERVGVQFQEASYPDKITAVSYTHLDVYKRQGYPFPDPPPPGTKAAQ